MSDNRSVPTSSAGASGPASKEGAVLGRYTLHAPIASGGMATVHLARMRGSVGFARVVAVKCIHPHVARDADFVAMFLDEARLASRVRHPNVASVLDVAVAGGDVYLVMEYIVGESLAGLMRSLRAQNDRVPLPLAVHVMCDVLHGLHAAHEATDEQGERLGIVHRDVSPQNILVGTDGVARILDFGVAKAAGRMYTTRSGQLKGKLGYMAPEQIRGEPVTPATDVYSAGVTLWELMTGRRMIEADSEAELVLKSLSADIPAPHEVDGEIPEALSRIVERAISKQPRDRFQTALAFVEALEGAAGLVSARRVGEWVSRVADAALAERRALVQRIEAEPVPPSAPPAKPPASPPPAAPHSPSVGQPSSSRRWARRALVPAMAAGLLLTGFLLRSPPSSKAPAAEPLEARARAADSVPPVAPAPATDSAPSSRPLAPMASATTAVSASARFTAPAPRRLGSATPAPSASSPRRGPGVPDELLGRF